MNFGERVRELRKERGLSQRELAIQAGIDFTYLSKIENARMDPPSEKVILHMAEVLDTDPDELTLLAGKIPSDVKERINVEMIKALRRSLDGDFKSKEDFRRALGNERNRER
jgi:transcriptional regulator with XRE-family HTH domain